MKHIKWLLKELEGDEILIKQFIKNRVLDITGIPFDWIKYYYNQSKRFYNNSAASLNENNIEWIVTKIKVLTHELDKGLHMPEPRNGFGREKARTLVLYLRNYLDFQNFNYEYDAYLDAVEVLREYCASAEQYNLDISFINLDEFKIDNTKIHNRLDQTGIYRYDEKLSQFDFKKFAFSRHSIRYFESEYKISQTEFEKAVEIARMSPSACNRQSVRVMLINDENLASKVLEIQGGTRGFKNANNCILIMSDLNNYWYDGEMNTAFIDAGIFTMNLLYSLKYYGIDSCPLIWDDNAYRRDSLDKIIDIPKNYFIMCVLAVGKADLNAKALFSPRKDTNNIILNVRRKY